MRTAPERDVLTHIAPVGPEFVRIGELAGITIARTGQQHDDGARSDFDITDLHPDRDAPDVDRSFAAGKDGDRTGTCPGGTSDR